MRHAFVVIAAVLLASPAWAEEAVIRRHSRLWEAAPGSTLPADMLAPEGKTRWYLDTWVAGPVRSRTLEASDGRVTVREAVAGPAGDAASSRIVSDPTGGDAALRWLFPERYPDALALGTMQVLDLEEGRDGRTDRLRIEMRVEGVGWAHLPSGPREVALLRILTLRAEPGDRGLAPEFLVHQWLDPRAGVVAEIAGPASADGRGRSSISEAAVADGAITAAADLKIYADQVEVAPFSSVLYAWNLGPGTPISSLTPDGHATAADLIAASTWDFSGNDGSRVQIPGTTSANNTVNVVGSGTDFTRDLAAGDYISLSSDPSTFSRVATVTDATHLTVLDPLGDGTSQNIGKRIEQAITSTPINSAETCNWQQCGYTVAAGKLDRRDSSIDRFDGSKVIKDNTVSVREDRATDVTIWLRAGAQKEGKEGTFGDGESRICYVTFGGTTRTEVPTWRLSHQDANGWFMQAGDSWQGGPFACEQNIFNQLCGAPQLFDKLYAQACGTHAGTVSGEVLKGGVITLPSGHTFNALLVRNVADFCVYIPPAGCLSFLKVDEVRTVNYIWQVPNLGTLVRLQSVQNPPDTTSFTTVEEASIGFGLYPPLSISVTDTQDRSVSLSWDPGLDTRRIDGYRIYWDTDSGGSSSYSFDSETNGSQVSFAGTSATITGLDPATTYFFTVTSRSTYRDPSTGANTVYESLVYPTQVSGDPSFVYPIEVQTTTTCTTPIAEVGGVTVDKSGASYEICWQPVSDPCLVGYRVIGADSPESIGNFVPVAATGLETCWTGNPTQSYFLVVARGTGGDGPTGR